MTIDSGPIDEYRLAQIRVTRHYDAQMADMERTENPHNIADRAWATKLLRRAREAERYDPPPTGIGGRIFP